MTPSPPRPPLLPIRAALPLPAATPSPPPPSLYLPFPSPDAAMPSPLRTPPLTRILRLHRRPRPSNPPSSPTSPVLSSLPFSSPAAPFLASPLPTRGKPDPRRQAWHSEEAEAAAMECVFGVVGRDFAVVVADTSAVQSILIHKNDEGKIMLLDSHMDLGASGEPGDRSLIAAYLLVLNGYKNVFHLNGGLNTWFKAYKLLK